MFKKTIKIWFIFPFLLFFLFAYSYAQNKIVFLSDSQEPLWVEKLFIRCSNNSEAADAIFNAIKKDEKVKAVFHMGDLTALGSLNSEWNKIDLFTAGLKKSNISFYPVMGNHEYFIFSESGKSKFVNRFGAKASEWYCVNIGNTAVIMLNSNFSKLKNSEIIKQDDWYRNKLNELNNDKNIKSVIVCLHHSPYTFSKIVDPSLEVRDHFVNQFINSPKCRVFISGHAHLSEHFKIHNKDFIVAGGGGGALHGVLPKEKQKLDKGDSLIFNNNSRGIFHFVECEENSGNLKFTVKKLNDDLKTFTDIHYFQTGK